MVGRRGAARMIVLVPRGSARTGVTITLDEDESHHLRVRRADAGETVELRDGAGLSGMGVLEVQGRSWAVRVTEASFRAAPAPLTLAVAAGDRERFLWIAEKAAELAVYRVVPIETERTRSVGTRVRPAHLEKLARRALDATKQSGACWSPEIGALESFDSFVSAPREGARWLADASGTAPEFGAGAITVLVGPEGGLAPAERAAAHASGWIPVALGQGVLRFETAAIAAAAYVAIERQRRA
jgi:16S rRNA (uracil1498-N3)-methyltransferase